MVEKEVGPSLAVCPMSVRGNRLKLFAQLFQWPGADYSYKYAFPNLALVLKKTLRET